MKEIQVKGNDTGIKVFINGVPDLTQIPKEITDTLVTTLEFQISEHFEQEHSKIRAKEKNSQI